MPTPPTNETSFIPTGERTEPLTTVIPTTTDTPTSTTITEIHEEDRFLRIQDFIRFFRDLVIVLIIAMIIRFAVVTPFTISGSSMENSYHDGESIIVNKFSYLMLGSIARVGNPVRGDVVVFTPHVSVEKEYYIKRVIGLPGDTIKFDGGYVYVEPNGGTKFVKLSEDYLSAVNNGHTNLSPDVTDRTFTVPADEYWVMGDNRINSSDSRTCFRSCMIDGSSHYVARSDIVGSVLLDLGRFTIFSSPSIHDGPFTWIEKPSFFDTPRKWTYPELQ